jgi:hypothetical protein
MIGRTGRTGAAFWQTSKMPTERQLGDELGVGLGDGDEAVDELDRGVAAPVDVGCVCWLGSRITTTVAAGSEPIACGWTVTVT